MALAAMVDSAADGRARSSTEAWFWAAWYNTWLIIKLTPKGVVFSFLCTEAWCVSLQLYDEMGSRHRVRPPLLNIIKTATVPNDHCKRDNTKQFHQTFDDKINKQVRVKFPLTRKLVRSEFLLSALHVIVVAADSCHISSCHALLVQL